MISSVFRNFDKIDGNDEERSGGGRYEFTPKHQRSIKNNPMCGICFPQWIAILHTRRHQIEWSIYWPRLLFISYMSILNSVMGVIDALVYGKKIKNAEINPRPVFILGHPRTGTTLLHSLLALDEQQFSYCSTFCAGFPSSFLWFESIGKILFRGVIDDTRPMDNVKLDFDLPQEDELATNVLSAGMSPYMPLFFMCQEPEFRPYYAFDENAKKSDEQLEMSAMASARKRWVDSFLFLLRKLTVRDRKRLESEANPNIKINQRGRRLILKSPVHTARISLLNQLFPEAQFVYIHRNPYDVFRSAAHMADTTYWYTYMNTPSNQQITEFILRQYEILYERYEEGRREVLSEGVSANEVAEEMKGSGQTRLKRLVEVSFDELSEKPVQTARKIYQQLGWDWTPAYQERLKDLLGGEEFRSYKKNSHKPLDSTIKDVINKRWGPSFDRFGYQKE